MKNQKKSQPDSDQGRKKSPSHSSSTKRPTETKRIGDSAKPRQPEQVLTWQKAIFEGSRDAIFITDEDSRITVVNEAACALTGYSREELLTMRIPDLHEEIDLHAYQTYHDRIMAGEETFSNAKIFRKDGRKVDTEFNNRRILIDGLPYMHTTARDITERKRAAEALRESEEKTRALLNATTDIAFLLDANGIALAVNDIAARSLGRPADELVGKNLYEYIPAEMAQTRREHINRAIQTQEIVEFEDRRGDNWFFNRVYPVPGTGNQTARVAIFATNITERKQAEEKLRESEAKYRLLVDELKDGFYMSDLNGVLTFANRALARMHGFEHPDEIVGRNFLDFVPLGKDSKLNKQYQTVMQTGSSSEAIIAEIVRRDGTRAFIEIKPQVIFEGGKPVGSRGTMYDITERKQAQERLHESEERYRDLVENSHELIYTHDLHGQILSVNHTAALRLGHNPSALIGRNLGELLAADEKALFEDYLGRIRRKGSATGVWVLQSATGERRIWEYTSSLRSDAKQGPYVRGMAHDTTERIRIEKELRENEERFHKIFDGGPIGMVLTSRDLKFFSANPAFCQMLGYTAEEMNIRTFLDVTHPEHRETDRQNVEKMWRGEIPEYRTEKRYIAKNGDIHWGSLSTSLIRGQAGEPLYALAMVEDITERRQAEQAQRDIEARYRFVSENAADVIWVLNPNSGKFTYVSPSVEKLRGYTPAEVMAQPISEALTPESLQLVNADMAVRLPAFLAKGKGKDSFIDQVDQPCKDGSVVNTEVTTTYLFNEHGQVEIVGVSRDITERKRAALRQDIIHQVLRTVSGQLDMQVLAQSAIEMIARMTSYPHVCLALPDEKGTRWVVRGAAGSLAAELGANHPIHQGVIGRAFKTKKNQWVRDILKDGSYMRDVGMAGTPGLRSEIVTLLRRGDQVLGALNIESERADVFTDDDAAMFQSLADVIALAVENAQLYQAAQKDITERKQAEEQVRLSLAQNQNILDAIPDLMFEVDREGRFYNYHDPSKINLYAPPEVFMGKTVGEILPAPVAKIALEAIAQAAEHGWHRGATYALELPTGLRWFELSIQKESGRPNNEDRFLVLARDITERKQAEEQLRYQALLLANVNDAIIASDAHYRLTAWNAAAESLYGWKAEEVLGKNGLEIVRTEWPGVEAEIMRRSITEMGNWRGEARQVRRDGTQFPVEVSSMVLRSENGQITGYISVNRDITERKQAEAALRESHQLLAKSLASLHDAIFILDVNTTEVKDCNPAASQIFGYSREEMLGRTTAFLHVDDQALAKFRLVLSKAVEEQGFLNQFEFRMKRRDGTIFPTEHGVMPIEDAHGKQSGWVSVVRDITERKRVEELLHQSEERYKLMFEQAPLAINITRGTEITYCNPTYLSMFGFASLKEIQSIPPLELFTPEWRPIVQENIRRRSQGLTSPNGYEAECFRKDGTRFSVQMNFVRTMFSDGLATVGFILDITERKRAEAALAASREQLRALSQYLQAAREEERTHIAREIHDELGQALTAMKMDLAWLSRQLPPEQSSLVQKTAAMSDMVDSTIQMVRRVASQLRPGMLDDLGLVAALEWQAGEFQSRTGIACNLNLPENVTVLNQDQATTMFRIFQETLTNISRHARATRVRIAMRELPEYIDLVVRDNGIGITQGQLNDPRSLGLTGMRERVQTFGGTLQFKSSPGKGTSVHVRMPRVNMPLKKES